MIKKFLVTGVAGDIGMGVGRILKEEYPSSILIGCDVNSDNPSLAVYSHFHKSPYATTKGYQEFILELINKYSIEYVIPTSESEIDFFWASNLVEKLHNIKRKVLILDKNVVDISLDKYRTANFLRDNSLNYPVTALAEQFEVNKSIEFPMILKPRSGQGSKNITILSSPSDICNQNIGSGFIIQEFLPDEEQEYTCCIFGSMNEYRVLILKRKLSCGSTSSGEVVYSSKIEEYIRLIACALEVEGSINFQLRVTDRGPVLFEINPRLSSTLVFRHKLGFKDLIWNIEKLDDQNLSVYKTPKEGTCFYRGVTEYIFEVNDAN